MEKSNSYLKLCTPEQLKDVYSELNITEESLERDVAYLMQWLEQTPHLPNIKSKETLVSILIGCKNSLQKTKTHIDYYYTRRSLRQDLFAYRDPCCDQVKKAMKWIGLIPLPKLTPECYRIIVLRLFKPESDKLPSYDSLLSSYQLQYDVLNKVDKNKGAILILDFRNISFGFATMVIQDFKKIADLNQKTALNRWKKFIVLNPEPLVQQMVTLAKAFFSKKLADRIDVWRKDAEALAEVLPKDVLSSTYGGNEPPMEELKDYWYDYVAQFRDWFKAEESINADISKRPKDDPLSIELAGLGLAGSFRKINLD